MHHLRLGNDVDRSLDGIRLGRVDAGAHKEREMDRRNHIGDNGRRIRNALLVVEAVPGGGGVARVGAHLGVVVDGGVVLVRARLRADAVAVPRALEPGAEEARQDDADEGDDERQGNVRAGMDAEVELAECAGDEFSDAPEQGDEALIVSIDNYHKEPQRMRRV